MEDRKLQHLHPTLEIIAEELRERRIPCRLEGEKGKRTFRGASLYQEGALREDLLYILRPEEAEAFPSESYAFVCTESIPGAREQLVCPGQRELDLVNVLLSLFSRYQQWEMQLDEMVYRNVRLHDLCEAGAEMLENPVCIHDDWFIMIAVSKELPKVMPPDYIMSSNREFVPRSIVEDFNFDEDYEETFDYRTAQFWRIAPGTPGCLYVNIWDGEVYQGRLLAVEHHRPFRKADYMLVEFLTQRASLLLQRQRLGAVRSYRSMDDVMFDLLSGGKTDPADEVQLLQMLGWNKSDKLTCIRIQSQQDDAAPVMEHVLHSDLFRYFPNSYIMMEGRRQCVILNLSRQPTTLHRIQHALAPVCRDYCRYAGISSPVRGIRELPIAYQQAEVALNQAFRLRSHRWIIPFSECAMDYILSSLQTDQQLHHLAAPELQLLMEHDREKGTQYFETLRTYLLQERDIPRTSEALIIHRTTLQYRLKKIRMLTELDLDDPAQRLYLFLSLWLLDREGRNGQKETGK